MGYNFIPNKFKRHAKRESTYKPQPPKIKPFITYWTPTRGPPNKKSMVKTFVMQTITKIDTVRLSEEINKQHNCIIYGENKLFIVEGLEPKPWGKLIEITEKAVNQLT